MKLSQMKHCSGCRDNFYNGYNPYGIKECWNLKDAKIIWRKAVPLSQYPPWTQKAQRYPSCYRKKGYVFVGPKQTH